MIALPKVMPQGVEIDIPVVGKVVGKTVVPPVAVTEKDEFSGIIEIHGLGLPVSPTQSMVGRHGIVLRKYLQKMVTMPVKRGFIPILT
jgi:hypothetical protein